MNTEIIRNSVNRTSIIIDPTTKEPVTKTIITKKGNKKVITVKEYTLMLPFKKDKKHEKVTRVGYISPFSTKKGMPKTLIPRKYDGLWSPMAEQIRKDYRSMIKKLSESETETHIHNAYYKGNPNELGLYEVSRKIKRTFVPLPSMKLTANERIEALATHKSLMDLKRSERKAQRVDAKELVSKILPAFNKESFTDDIRRRLLHRKDPVKRTDGRTMSFSNNYVKNMLLNKDKKFTVIEHHESELKSGKKYDSPFQTVTTDSYEEAVEVMNGWYERAADYKDGKTRRIIIANQEDAVKNRPIKNVLCEKVYNSPLAA